MAAAGRVGGCVLGTRSTRAGDTAARSSAPGAHATLPPPAWPSRYAAARRGAQCRGQRPLEGAAHRGGVPGRGPARLRQPCDDSRTARIWANFAKPMSRLCLALVCVFPLKHSQTHGDCIAGARKSAGCLRVPGLAAAMAQPRRSGSLSTLAGPAPMAATAVQSHARGC